MRTLQLTKPDGTAIHIVPSRVIAFYKQEQEEKPFFGSTQIELEQLTLWVSETPEVINAHLKNA